MKLIAPVFRLSFFSICDIGPRRWSGAVLLQVLRRDDAAVPPHIAEGTEGGKPRPPGGERGAASAEKGSVYSNSELKRIFHFFTFFFSIYFSLFFE